MGGACDSYGNMRNACNILLRIPEGKDPLVDLGVHERIILKLIMQNMI